MLVEEGPTPKNLRFTAVNAENTGWSLTHMGEAARALPYLRRGHDMFRRVAAADPENREAQNDIADALEALAQGQAGVGELREAIADAQARLGKYYAALAARPDTRPHERAENWRRARDHYRQAHTNALLARERGTLSATGSYKPELFAAEVDKCETALGGL